VQDRSCTDGKKQGGPTKAMDGAARSVVERQSSRERMATCASLLPSDDDNGTAAQSGRSIMRAAAPPGSGFDGNILPQDPS